MKEKPPEARDGVKARKNRRAVGFERGRPEPAGRSARPHGAVTTGEMTNYVT